MFDEAKATQLFDKLETEVKGRIDKLSDLVDTQAQEIRSQGGTTTETKQSIEKLEGEIKSIGEAYEELKDLAPQMREMKAAMDRPGGPSHKGRTAPGHRFAESEAYKHFADVKSETKTGPVELGSMDNLLPERKALTSDEGVWGGAGILIEPLLLPGILELPQRELRFRDLVNVQQVSGDSVRYIKETGYANLFTVSTSNAASGQAAIIVESTSGFFAGQTVQVGGVTKVVQSVNNATNTLTMTTNFGTLVNSGTEVTSDHLEGTPHGGKKPQSSIRLDDEVASIITIAHWIAAHRQTLEDVPQLQGYVNSRLLFGLDMAVEYQGFYGAGTSTSLLGLFNTPGVQDQGTRTGNDPNGRPWTEIDWIRMALTKAQVAEYPVNGIMVNPLNWQNIELAKDADGRYLWITATDQGIRRLFGVPAVVTTAIRAGDFLTGAFGLGVTLYDRQAANIRISDSHANMFIENMLAILAELRLGLAAIRPESIIKGKF